MIQTLALAAAAASLVLPLPAHASIVDTNPQDGATITTLPETFTVTASEDVLAVEGSTSNVILITDQAGLYYGDGCTTASGPTLSTAATLGEAGVYTMRYGLVSADGHPIEGVVDFAWQPGDDAAAVPGQSSAPTCGATTPSETPTPEPTAEPTESAEPTASSEPPSSSTAPSTAPTGAPEEGDGEGGLPALAYVGIGIALLAAVAGVIIATYRRGLRKELSDRDEPQDPDEPRDPDAR
ncbi:copper resistance CopC family protein [Agrococcus jejuensis]|uniref:copper resistance CopC family protein n=1 Tax=Agrococcus jejuensis TaxID=399736 RepID=UPI00155FB764|nr:copper resistance CopC family protein [Agrococcus jejuensis]